MGLSIHSTTSESGRIEQMATLGNSELLAYQSCFSNLIQMGTKGENLIYFVVSQLAHSGGRFPIENNTKLHIFSYIVAIFTACKKANYI